MIICECGASIFGDSAECWKCGKLIEDRRKKPARREVDHDADMMRELYQAYGKLELARDMSSKNGRNALLRCAACRTVFIAFTIQQTSVALPLAALVHKCKTRTRA